ncbi:efflux RND transporter periplasmic adaptor subunit [Dyella silvatica]|uniref:efflux RND transporter periplasmic adaptor subunit n=1 Tax=Dyella silvatica TaxID=2992128 RepID=UPI002252062C|nr:efflux RND transporter periplasmic adaptor subunit [Dyella silvatica]
MKQAHRLFLAISLALVLPLAPSAFAAEKQAPAPAPAESNPLQLDAQAIRTAGIQAAPAVRRNLRQELKAPGEVQADAYATVLVSPRMPAQVVKRRARLGDKVKTGQPLVTLSSVDVADVQGALIVSDQEWRRVSSLGPQAVSARRYMEVKVQRDQARAKLRAFGLSEGQINAMLRAGSARADGTFELLSPAAGRITSDSFTVGQWIEPGRTLFTLVNEDTVWVQAQLASSDAASVKLGDDARVVTHGQTIPGKVVQLPHQANEQTRTVPVRIQVSNSNDLLHNGEFVDTYLATAGSREALAVPTAAVVLLQNQSTVFVDKGKGLYEPVPVVTGETQGDVTVITDGLKVGEPVVVKGAFALKARLLKSQIGGGD